MSFRRLLILAVALTAISSPAAEMTAPVSLEAGWENPPLDARLRAYWWWLNGNVTKASITRDLEEMKAKGFGGALICDAGGAEQDGNDQVPHGPTFFTREWRELYRHTLREANRLGLEMSLNILSGWNLGGPMVSADDAAKKLVWSELRLRGGARIEQALPAPGSRDNYYRDAFVVAFQIEEKQPAETVFSGITASSEQGDHPAKDAGDRREETYWVSGSTEPGSGPSREKPQWLQLNFTQPVVAGKLTLQPRPGYGPRQCELLSSRDGKTFSTVKTFVATEKGSTTVTFPSVTGSGFRVVMSGAFDPRSPEKPRNVQVAELVLSGDQGAWPAGGRARGRIQNWEQKAMHKALHSSAPDTTPLFQDLAAQPGEADCRATAVLDLTSKLDSKGVLRWDAPAGTWQIQRFGCTIGDHSRVSTCSEGWQGYALDVLDAGAFERYWNAVVEPLVADAGPLAGTTLKYLHTDSWEVEPLNWTPKFREEFQKRRGYDLVPYLPVLAGRIVENRQVSNRFLHDFRKTLGDLAIDCHYKIFRERAHKHNLLMHPESGGPHAVPIDAQRCLGWDDAPMSEFWAWSWRHRVGDENRFFVKQPASAAHTYGHRLVLAEGFTTIGPHWQETVWDNLKPSFDKALCEGLNLLVWHAFVCSPAEMGMPGQQYFAGTHFNPNSTWWEKSGAFLAYVDRCQFLLQQGLFVADTACYYGDHVPNFAQLKRSDPAQVLPGYDYDVLTEEAILTRLQVKDGRLVLPDGMSYRVLKLPDRTMISLPVLRRLKDLVTAGATVIGPKSAEASTLQDFPQCDLEVQKLADELWGKTANAALHPLGQGRVIAGRNAREVLLTDGVRPDFEYSGGQPDAMVDYVHRSAEGAEIYFVANRSNRWENLVCTFRVSGKAPELWNAVSGKRQFAAAYEEKDGRVSVPLEFSPCGSWFVIFRSPAGQHPATARTNVRTFTEKGLLTGPWNLRFDPKWGGPASVDFSVLQSWTERPEPGIKYYSGTAVYAKTFALPAGLRSGAKCWLDLGNLRELAEVRLNGTNLGVVWAPPFRIDISGVVKPAENLLEVEVVNFWPNRIIGDAALPVAQRLTRTNIRKLTKDTALMESGLLGPVRLLQED